MRKFLLLSLLSTIFITGCQQEPQTPTPPAATTRKVTYIVMATLDNEIAPDGIKVMTEFTQNSTQDDQAVMVVNYNKAYRDANNIKGTMYYHSVGGVQTVIEATPTMEKIGEQSKYFTKIINLAVEKAPADDYIVVFNSHGSGWSYDDAADPITRSTLSVNDEQKLFGSPLTLNRMIQGYKNSKLAEMGKKIKMIYFDACLMHTVENLTELSAIAQYSLGSPSTSIDAGQVAAQLVQNVRKNNDFEQALLTTAEFINNSWKESDYFMVNQVVSLQKMDQIPALTGKIVDRIMTIIKNDADKKKAVQDIRSQVFSYNTAGKNPETGKEEILVFPLYDMGDFLFRVKAALDQDAIYCQLYDQFVKAADEALLFSKPNRENRFPNLGGELAEGNTRYCFTVLLVHNEASGGVSDYIGTAYETLMMQTAGKWRDLLIELQPIDTRLPKGSDC